jgi:hypothetical protein
LGLGLGIGMGLGMGVWLGLGSAFTCGGGTARGERHLLVHKLGARPGLVLEQRDARAALLALVRGRGIGLGLGERLGVGLGLGLGLAHLDHLVVGRHTALGVGLGEVVHAEAWV